jgi:DNA (cytosine-5)-methyltransferase 1
MRSVELFAGAGGLAMGVSGAGFEHVAVIERDPHACGTIRENKQAGLRPFINWPLVEGDVRDFDYSSFRSKVDLVAGGPPCQPFSQGGKHKGYLDDRDMFPEAVRAVRALQPRAFVFENVKGLTRSVFFNYFQYICLRLEFPDITVKFGDTWTDHFIRLQRIKSSGQYNGLRYNVVKQVLNAADYGAPQKRERVLIVGFRSDLKIDWNFPKQTHNHDSLLREQWLTGEYWDRHKVSKKQKPGLSPNLFCRIEKLRNEKISPSVLSWRTVRDAISDLPDPERDNKPCMLSSHNFQPGARMYPGHTGSPMDEPAKTLKAGDHGVPGGENMLVRPDGSVRYFTIRESARLQTFPDEFIFRGSWTESMRQLGNAVPVLLAQIIASSVAKRLRELDKKLAKGRGN